MDAQIKRKCFPKDQKQRQKKGFNENVMSIQIRLCLITIYLFHFH